ncbi:hypothetical protein FACS18948_6660 [Clostridia bacterium]|nr:hypothetical protein FACS18948_6660 [Clostridia bacterium]
MATESVITIEVALILAVGSLLLGLIQLVRGIMKDRRAPENARQLRLDGDVIRIQDELRGLHRQSEIMQDRMERSFVDDSRQRFEQQEARNTQYDEAILRIGGYLATVMVSMRVLLSQVRDDPAAAQAVTDIESVLKNMRL